MTSHWLFFHSPHDTTFYMFDIQYYLPSQKSKSRFNQEKARFNQDEYNFNGIN